MNIKKLISLFLSIMMLLGVVAMPVMADETGKAESDEAKAAIAELAAELPQTVAELKELGFEYVCATYGVDLYVIKDKENENFGDVYFVYSEQPGGEGKVLFNTQKATETYYLPSEDSATYADDMKTYIDRYKTTIFQSPHEYISTTMKYVYEYNEGKNAGQIMFIDELTGAAAFLDKATGQILTTNPYDIGTSKANSETKGKLLSQFVFDYVKGQNGNTYNTFENAAKNMQVSYDRIRGGVRVEYTVGRMETRILLPILIERTRFEEEILAKFTVANKAPTTDMTPEQIEDQVERDIKKLLAYYTLRDLDAYKGSARDNVLIQYPIIEKYDFYEFNEQGSTRPKYQMETLIKEYTDYTYEDLQSDHLLLEYQGNETNPPLFKMAIEYYFDEDGIKIRVPAKSISYNKDTFTITQLRILPYLGAGRHGDTGYTFYPDGSGALIRFEDIGTQTKVITGKVYGQDYGFYATSGQNKEVMRLPAFGVKRDQNFTIVEHSEEYTVQYTDTREVDGEMMDVTTNESFKLNYGIDVTSQNGVFAPEESDYTSVLIDSNLDAEPANDLKQDLFMAAIEKNNAEKPDNLVALPENKNVDGRTAYLAYMTEGDSLVQISTDHGGITHEYHSAYATVYPELADTYALSSGDEWTVDIERNYTGNYTFRIFMLKEDNADYVGMANALRAYLIATGELVENDIDDNQSIPLFLENFGSIKTTQKVVGIPVTENTPLTTFEQSKTMIDELIANDVTNINLKLTGWYNGGMEHTAPAKLKVQKAIGGEKGLKNLNSYAASISEDATLKANVEIYPDLDFTYVMADKSFDGFKDKDDAVRTVDNKIASHRVYNALYQGFVRDDLLIINADRMLEFYDKISDKYNGYGIPGISVATLGSELSSDNGEDNIMTREESKEAISALLSELEADGKKILVSGGNAFTYKYADLITDLPLDSSRNIYASEAVPFLGMVLHGCIEFTGTAVNLDGDYNYSVLKCVENGANPYFILSYSDDEVDNTSELKNFPMFSKYYSIKYNIWKEDLIGTYKKLNAALKDIQACTIVDHELIDDDIVRVEYSNGYTYILNYGANNYQYEGVADIASLDFVRVTDAGKDLVKIESFKLDDNAESATYGDVLTSAVVLNKGTASSVYNGTAIEPSGSVVVKN